MSTRDWSRRAFLVASSVLLGMGRTPSSGRLRMSLPWSLTRIDPHDSNDPAAAFFGPAIAEPLFARDVRGTVYSTLADGLPKPTKHGCLVHLRPGLRGSHGRKLESADVAWSLSRARRLGAKPLLGDLPPPKVVPGEALTVMFPAAEPKRLAEALTSPLCAIVPRSFNPEAPEGTGAFRARLAPRRLVLSRNPWAPRGGSYLDEVSVETAPDLAEALRQFEAAEVDVGWLGRGLHRPRAGSILIDAGDVGWIVLHSGRSAGRWGAPGAAAQLASGIENSALERFGLGRVQHRSASQGYAGPPCELLARDDSSFLLELGRSLTALLSRPGHEITLSPAPPSVVQSRKRAGDYGFLLDVARCLGPSTREQQLSLLHEADPRLGQHAPAIDPNLDSDALIVATTATLSLAVVGRLRVVVATLPNLHGLASGRLGDTWLDPS